MTLRLRGAALGLVSVACSHAAAPPAAIPSTTAPSAEVRLPAEPGAPGPIARPEWGVYFEDLHVRGTIAVYDSADGKLACSDAAQCAVPAHPASTFKIANTMIGLETQILEDGETKMPWDGKEYPVPEWNQDNTLRTALRVSCVPCFQAVARQVGPARMKDWVERLDYGNHDISGGIDQFWLTGGLRISPLQQIDFLRRFDEGKLAISARTSEIVHDVLTLDVGPEHVLVGKTGLLQDAAAPDQLTAWFVGFVELGKRRVFFATLINHADAGVDVKPLRRRVTERVLRAMGALPADAARAPAD